MNRIAVIFVFALSLLVLPVRAQSGLTDVTFFLTFIPNVQFSPLYVAIEKGYFAEAGLNVTLQYGDEPDGVTLIAADQLKFGMIGGEQVIQARSQGLPVVFVYEWFQQYPVGVVVAEPTEIETVPDLAGRRVGIPGRFGASYSGLVALLSAFDMTEEDIQLESIGFNAPEVVCVGAVEASVIYINNEPLQIQRRAEAEDCGDVTGVRVIPVGSAVDLVSNGIVTNEATIADQPELVAAVVGAFDAALRDVIRNPAEAYLLSQAHVENLPITDDLAGALAVEAEDQVAFLLTEPDAEAIIESRTAMYERLSYVFAEDLLQFEVLLRTIELFEAERLGQTDPESWESTQEVLVQMGFVESAIDLAGAYTNDFLPPVETGDDAD